MPNPDVHPGRSTHDPGRHHVPVLPRPGSMASASREEQIQIRICAQGSNLSPQAPQSATCGVVGVIHKPSKRYSEYVPAILSCGHWEETGTLSKHSHAVIRHTATGATSAYATHDGGNDYNAARNFAADCGRVCGCDFVEHRNRRRSRKADQVTGFTVPTGSAEPEFITKLWERHRTILEGLHSMAATGVRPNIRKARREAKALGEVERRLHDAFQAPPEGGWKVIKI